MVMLMVCCSHSKTHRASSSTTVIVDGLRLVQGRTAGGSRAEQAFTLPLSSTAAISALLFPHYCGTEGIGEASDYQNARQDQGGTVFFALIHCIHS